MIQHLMDAELQHGALVGADSGGRKKQLDANPAVGIVSNVTNTDAQ